MTTATRKRPEVVERVAVDEQHCRDVVRGRQVRARDPERRWPARLPLPVALALNVIVSGRLPLANATWLPAGSICILNTLGLPLRPSCIIRPKATP